MGTITIPELPNSSDLDKNDYIIIYNTESNPDVLTYKGRIGDVLSLQNAIQSVNGKSGSTITITPDDLNDSVTLNKFVVATDKAKIALIRTDQGSGTFLAGDGTYRTAGTAIGNNNYTVNTITDRDSLSGVNNGDRVLVIDASSDPVVARGAALYFWNSTIGQYVLVADSIELNFTVSGLTTQFGVYTGTTAPNTFALKSKFNSFTGTTNGRVTTIEGNYITGATNLGVGNSLFTSVSNHKIQLKSLKGGTGITIVSTSTGLTFNGATVGNFVSASTFNLFTGTTAPATYALKSNFNTYTGTTAPSQFQSHSSIVTLTGTSLPATYKSITSFNAYTASTINITSANNGLTKTGNNVRLGGALSGTTTISLSTNTLSFSGTTGVFRIQNNKGGSNLLFASGNTVGVNTATPAATIQINGSGSNPTLKTVGAGTGTNYSIRNFQSDGTTEIFSLKDNGLLAHTSKVSGSIFTSTWTATGTTQNAYQIKPTIVGSGTASDTYYGLFINSSFTQGANSQNISALRVVSTINNGGFTQGANKGIEVTDGNSSLSIVAGSNSVFLDALGSGTYFIRRGGISNITINSTSTVSINNGASLGATTSFSIAPTNNISLGSASVIGILNSPTYNATGTYSGSIIGYDYHPTITSLSSGSTHYAALFRTGLVGIGTATPTATLQVNGSGTNPTFSTVGVGTSTNYSIRSFQSDGTTEIFSLKDNGLFAFTPKIQGSSIGGSWTSTASGQSNVNFGGSFTLSSGSTTISGYKFSPTITGNVAGANQLFGTQFAPSIVGTSANETLSSVSISGTFSGTFNNASHLAIVSAGNENFGIRYKQGGGSNIWSVNPTGTMSIGSSSSLQIGTANGNGTFNLAASAAQYTVPNNNGNTNAAGHTFTVTNGISSTTGANALVRINGVNLVNSNNISFYGLQINPTWNSTGTGSTVVGIEYAPTVTAAAGVHYALRASVGDIWLNSSAVGGKIKAGKFTTGAGVTASIITSGETRSLGGFNLSDPRNASNTQTGMYNSSGTVGIFHNNTLLTQSALVGNSSTGGDQIKIVSSFNPATGLTTANSSAININTGFAPTGGAVSMKSINITGNINIVSGSTWSGNIFGIDYNPTLTRRGNSTFYGFVSRPLGALNGYGLGSALPVATVHVIGSGTTTTPEIRQRTYSSNVSYTACILIGKSANG